MDIQELEEKKDKIYSFLQSKEYTPMKLKELASILQVPKQEKEEFKEVIDKLISEGKVIYDKRNCLCTRRAYRRRRRGARFGDQKIFSPVR